MDREGRAGRGEGREKGGARRGEKREGVYSCVVIHNKMASKIKCSRTGNSSKLVQLLCSLAE